MAIKRWTPKSMEKFFHEMLEEPMPERFLRRFPSLKWMKEFEEVSPAVDMYDKKEEIVVKAEVPGIDKENIKIGLLFHIQALLLARFLRGDLDGYPTFIWK